MSASLSINGHTYEFPIALASYGEFFLNGLNIQQIQTIPPRPPQIEFLLSTSFGFSGNPNAPNGVFSVLVVGVGESSGTFTGAVCVEGLVLFPALMSALACLA
jgi:hypothetical protein